MSLGTWIYTLINGAIVGKDEFGNKYYQQGSKVERPQRVVVYKGNVEASGVTEWHAWLHFTVDEPLTVQAAQARAWQQAHQPNQTGSPNAYRPEGHLLRGGNRRRYRGLRGLDS